MRRCTSHTGSSPLWYSTSSTPNSVVPSPKRAILTREWRSTASNARARTTHSCNGTSTRLGEAFMTSWEPPRGEHCSDVVRCQVSRFRDILWRCAMFDLGVLALRLVLGAVFLGHGAQKAFGAFGGPGFAGATGFVGSLGFRPARVWAALAVGGELAAGFLFLLGLLTPLAGLLVVATMVVAIAKVHGQKGFFVKKRRIRVQPGANRRRARGGRYGPG